MREKRYTAILLCMAAVAGALAGCGKDGAGDMRAGSGEDGEVFKGRYVEREEALPEQLEGWTVEQIFTVGDRVHLLASGQEAGKTVFREWELQEEGFADITGDWMLSLALPVSGNWMETQLLCGESGGSVLYAAYTTEGEEDYKAHLWREESGEAREITPREWTVPREEWGAYETPFGIAALDNGTLAALSPLCLEILDGSDGSVLETGEIEGQYDRVMSDGKNIWFGSGYGDSSGYVLEKRGEDSSRIRLSWGSGGLWFWPGRDGDLVAAGREGIFRGREEPSAEGGAEWEKLIEAAETDFSLSDRWCTGLAVAGDGRIYALFRKSEGGSVLKYYEYDADAVVKVTENLKLYTVRESNLLTQAAAMYHREHPDVMISIEYAYPKYYYDETDYNEVYQKLNTMLMGDAAPDILVMDHLNLDSYAEKGLLENIDDLVRPAEEKGELLTNITSGYVQEDGCRYVVPLEFAFGMAVGRDITAADMASMETLADFLGGEDFSYMGPLTVAELVDRFYPYFCGSIISDKKLDRAALGKYLEYLKRIGDNCGILERRDQDEKAFNVWRLASEAKLAFEEAEGFNNIMAPLAIMDYIQGDFSAFENCFVPMVQTGICAKSSHKDTARDFLQFALSETAQMTDSYGGFPVNAAALEKAAHSDRTDAEAETDILAEGGYVEFKIRDFSPEMADRLVAVCKGLNRPVKEDEKIREVLIEILGGYLNGTQSLEDMVQMAEDGLKMYLAE